MDAAGVDDQGNVWFFFISHQNLMLRLLNLNAFGTYIPISTRLRTST
jgi:hypothetical protein